MGSGTFIIEVKYDGENFWEELARCPTGLFWRDVYELAQKTFGKKAVRFRFIKGEEEEGVEDANE